MKVTDIKGVAPSNYKSGMLIGNKYRPLDMFIMIGAFVWAFLWLILLFFVFVPSVWAFLIFVLFIPVIAIALVQPMPNYHNTLEYLILLYRFSQKNKHFSNILVPSKDAINERNNKRKNKSKKERIN